MVWVEVEKVENLFVVFWAGDEANSAYLDALKEVEEEITNGANFEGIGVAVGYESKDILLENILQKNKLIFKQRDNLENYDYYLDVPEFEISYDNDTVYKAKRIDFSNANDAFSRDF